MSSALRRPSLIALVCAVCLVAGACSNSNDSSGSPDVTTGTLPRLGSTTVPDDSGSTPDTTPEDQAGGDVGLWLATPAGITDEKGDRYGRALDGETLRNPVDDGAGGVFYLRCVGEAENCSIEHAIERGADPIRIGEASGLLALGSMDDTPVLLTSWSDDSRAPSFDADVSSLVMRIIDLSDNSVMSTHEWFGWESGPMVADVEGGRFMGCFGEGDVCAMALKPTADELGTPVEVTADTAVTSAALNPDGTTLSWLEARLMDGDITAKTLLIPSGDVVSVSVWTAAEPPVIESVVGGPFVALRFAETVQVFELSETLGEPVELAVPASVTEMAIRLPSSGGSSVASTL